MNDENWLAGAAVKWTLDASEQIQAAGGDPVTVIRMLSPDALNTFVRNNLQLRYIVPRKDS